MAMFVHLAPEKKLAMIRRNGINRLRRSRGDFPGGVFAVPVTRNFYVSHQWLRELKRSHPGAFIAIYFRIPDEESVWVGHYGQSHQWMSAAEAVNEFLRSESKEGWEVVIPRRIASAEIHRTRQLQQVIGWRYQPDAHGHRPCGCDYCQRGQFGARQIREKYNTD